MTLETRRPGRPAKYPWDVWLDGQDKLLSRMEPPGTDLFIPRDVEVEALRSLILLTARRRGVAVSTQVRWWGGAHRDSESISIRFPRESPAAEESPDAGLGLSPEQQGELDALWSDSPQVLEIPAEPTAAPAGIRHRAAGDPR